MRWLIIKSKNLDHLPQWKRSVGISDNGTIFIPAAIGRDEKVVSISTLKYQTLFRIYANHVYVPVAWLPKHWPHSLDQCCFFARAAFKQYVDKGLRSNSLKTGERASHQKQTAAANPAALAEVLGSKPYISTDLG